MAFKITKQGFLPENEELKGRCTYCKTEVECLRGDLKNINYPITMQNNGTVGREACPFCGKEMNFYPKTTG